MNIENIKNVIQNSVKGAKIIRGINEYHIATNALLICKNDAHIQEKLVNDLLSLKIINNIRIIDGYLNISFHSHILDIITLTTQFINNEIVNIEFASPNPTGDMHLGHLRGTLYGAALSRFYNICGHKVITDMYINNFGNQFKKFIESIRIHANNLPTDNIEYKGEYVKEYANILPASFNEQTVVNMMVNRFKNTLQKLNIEHNRIIYESNQFENTEKAINILKSKNLIKIGRLVNQIDQNDKLIIQNINNCNDFVVGHIVYNAITKKNEIQYTYAGYDIGYSYGKFKEGFLNQICCVGEDHLGHIQKMNNIMKHIDEHINLNVVYTGIVKFEVNDEQIKMSKRQGNFITIDSVRDMYSISSLIQMIFSHAEHQKLNINLNHISDNNIYIITFIYEKIKQNKKSSAFINNEIIRYVIFWYECIQQAYKLNSIHTIYTYIFDFAQYLYNNDLYFESMHEEVLKIFNNALYILLLENKVENL